MKRMTYVDSKGNKVDQSLENRRPLLKLFFTINIILPIIIITIIILTVFKNQNCIKVYNEIKKAALKYAEYQDELPTVEGEKTIISIGDLYTEQFLKSENTNDLLCSGTVKITKYKKEYVYTLDTKNCNKCSVNEKYGKWSELQTTYPRKKAIVDVIPYYNYYDREVNNTKWSNYFDENEIEDEVSEYGIKLPFKIETIPEVPKEANIITIENNTTNYYRYRDRSWKWYDIEGNYSSFSSVQPEGFEKQDKDTEKYTEWSEYSLNSPTEKSYRTVETVSGYKFYYLNKSNQKVYYNSGKYSAKEDVDTEKYDKNDSDSATLYRYRDKMWRWYNGDKRKYSNYSSTMPEGKPFKDAELENLSAATQWEEKRYTDEDTKAYRLEETKVMTRFRTKYEMISLKVLKKPLERKAFQEKVGESIIDFNERKDKKLEVTYKFKYRKS